MIDKASVWVYDLETYPNFFSAGFKNMASGERFVFEISDWQDDGAALWEFLHRLRQDGCFGLGFNNLHFDYVILHEFLEIGRVRPVTAHDLYMKAEMIIQAPRNDWTHSVWESDHFFRQIDIFKIQHHDNFARSTSLKFIESARRSACIVDLPHPPGVPLKYEDRKPMIDYMCHDVNETEGYALDIWHKIEFRLQLDAKYGGRNSRINYNDTKIGKNHFLDLLKQEGIQVKDEMGPIQTPRLEGIKVADFLIDPGFEHPALVKVWEKYKTAIIHPSQTKGFFTGTSAEVNGFTMDFGTGGIHGSVHKRTFEEDDDHMIIDADIASMYPSIAIQYGYYPEHLGQHFLKIYDEMRTERLSYPKGAPENAALKLALNGTYGESNNKYSAFYDPQFTMSITITGQLLLARLGEVLIGNPSVQMIQMNTDGLTVRLPRSMEGWYHDVCDWFMGWSRMELEFATYRKMAVRDVNNYIAIGTDGKVKRKGAYAIDPDWHQDHSHLVVQKAVSKAVVDGVPLGDTIMNHKNRFDFMLTVKTRRADKLMWGDQQVQRTCRYYIANIGLGEKLWKEMPPLAGQEEPRRIGLHVDNEVLLANDARDFDWRKLNRYWYLQEAEKLMKGLGL